MYNFSALLSSVLPALVRIAGDFLHKNLTHIVIYVKINFQEVFMKISILIDMLFDFLSKRKVTAAYLAEKYDISTRTVYRYVEVLSKKLPLFIKRGRNGGICLSDTYRLPVGYMTEKEYSAAIDALIAAYTLQPEPRFLEARRKLSSQLKKEKQSLAVLTESDDFIIEEPLSSFTEKIHALKACISGEKLVKIDYCTDDGQTASLKIEPHALLLKHNVWQVYAFCHQQRAFSLFSLGRITALYVTETHFRKRPFQQECLLLKEEKRFTVRLKIEEKALLSIYALLGAENVIRLKEDWVAELALPDEKTALDLLVKLGANATVLAPPSLKQKWTEHVKKILRAYEEI